MTTKNLKDDFILNFTRDHTTVDRQGKNVAVNNPRYITGVNAYSLPKWESVGTVGEAMQYLGSGYDHDGVTLLTVLYARASGDIRIYRGNDFNTPVLTRSILRTVGTASRDLLENTSIEDANYAYVPKAGVVCHGLISILCVKHHVTNAQESVAIISMQATSSTATDWFSSGQIQVAGNLADLGGGATYHGLSRSEEWSMSNYFPDRDSQEMLGAWFPFVDYVHNPGSPGGQVGVMYASRTSVGSQWTTGSVKLVYDSVVTEGALTESHYHSASCHQHDDSRLVVVWAEGDGANNVVRAIVLTDGGGDIRANYSTATIVLTDSLSGSRGGANPLRANQWVSACPAETYGDIFVTTDGDYGAIQRFSMPNPDSMPTKLMITHVYGKEESDRSSGTSTGQNSLWIHCPAPERKRDYVARTFPDASNSSTTYEESGRIVFSQDGKSWGIAGKYPLSIGSRSVPFVCGGKIVMTNFSADTIMYGCDTPTSRTVDVLSIRSGYIQELRSLASADDEYWMTDQGTGNTTVKVTRNANGTLTHPITSEEIPAPPCNTPVHYVNCSTTNRVAFQARLGNDGSLPDSGESLCQSWIYPLQDGMIYRATYANGASSVNLASETTDHEIGSNGGWIPISTMGTPANQVGASYTKHRVETTATTPIPTKYLVAFQEVSNSGRMAGVPVDILRRGDLTVITADDEQCEITGFSLSSNWSIHLSLRIPEECWDTNVSSKLSTGIEPLASIRVDANNHIYFYVDLKNDKFKAEITVGGTLVDTLEVTSEFYRLDPINISLSNLFGTKIVVNIGGNRGGQDITTISSPSSIPKPTSIRIGKPDFSVVSQIDVIDVVIDENKAYSLEDLKDWNTSSPPYFSTGSIDYATLNHMIIS